jgi:folate-binding protein YgfZ
MTPFQVRLTGRSLAQVSGPDAESFLNGLLTCEITGMKAGEGRYGAVLTPQGKILFDIILLKLDHGFLMDCAGFERDGLLQRLQFYKLRSKVDFGPVDGGIVAGVGDAPPGAVVDPRTPLLGFRHYGSTRGDASDAAYEAHRIGLGVADSAADIGSGTLFPHEANLDQLNGVSFTKGCYVGQEVVSRTEHRGLARSRIIIARFGAEAPAAGTVLTADEKPLGTVLSHAGSVALALVRLDRLAEAVVKPDGVTFEVAPWARYSLDG